MIPMQSIYLALAFTTGFSLALPDISHAQTQQSAEVTQIPKADDVSVHKRIEMDMIDMPDLVQALTKNLGQLHYLRTVCFGKSDQTWRSYASKMMDVEAPTNQEKRRLLIKSFNDGYYDQQSRHASCSEGVSDEAAAIAENGRHLASMLGDPYRE